MCMPMIHNVHIHTHLTHTYTYILTSQHLTVVLSAHDCDMTCSSGSRFNWEKAPRHISPPPLVRERPTNSVLWFIQVTTGRKSLRLLAPLIPMLSAGPGLSAHCFPCPLSLFKRAARERERQRTTIFFPQSYIIYFWQCFGNHHQIESVDSEKLVKSLLQERTACQILTQFRRLNEMVFQCVFQLCIYKSRDPSQGHEEKQ